MHWVKTQDQEVELFSKKLRYFRNIIIRFKHYFSFFQLNVTEDQFLVNILNVLRYEANHNLQKLRQPVDKDKWSTEPALVNAFYNPNKNDIGE